MRVCVVLNHMPGPGAGGLEGQVHDVCTGLRNRGLDVHVACRPSLYMPAENIPLLEHIHAVTVDLTPAEIDNPFLCMWRTSKDLAQAENWGAYDVVHLQSHYGYHTALRLARMSGSRPALVTTFHLTAIGGIVRLQELGFPQEPDLLQTQPAAVMEATLAGLSDRSIAVSRQVYDDLTRGYGVAPGEVSVVYNGIDTELFAPIPRAEARAQLGIHPGLRYVLYVGPLFGFRRTILLDSLTYLDPDVRLLAIWPLTEPCRPDRAGDRLVPIGYVPRERMPLYYAAADLLAYPLVYTGFGLALLEASACGCVPVAFNVPPASELVPQTAWLVNEISPQAFARAINAALRDPETPRKAEAGMRAARAHRFSLDRMVDQTLTVYETALRDRAARADVAPRLIPHPPRSEIVARKSSPSFSVVDRTLRS
jgi:D-inositol-3-phosphate glycosyltransferase